MKFVKLAFVFAILISPVFAERHGTPTAWIGSYPRIAARARIQGDVVLNVTVDEDGLVENIALVSGAPILAVDAVSKMKLWRFDPAAPDEAPEATLTFTYRYRLDQSMNGIRVELNPAINTITLTTASPMAAREETGARIIID